MNLFGVEVNARNNEHLYSLTAQFMFTVRDLKNAELTEKLRQDMRVLFENMLSQAVCPASQVRRVWGKLYPVTDEGSDAFLIFTVRQYDSNDLLLIHVNDEQVFSIDDLIEKMIDVARRKAGVV